MKQRTVKNTNAKSEEQTNIAVLRPKLPEKLSGFDPIALNETICAYKQFIQEEYDLVLTSSTDFDEFLSVRDSVRAASPQPAFHPEAEREALSKSGFWLQGKRDGKTVQLSAYRLLDVDRDFRDWVISWQMWGHSRLGEDVNILAPRPNYPVSEFIENLRGPVCYAGEMWLDRSVRTKGESRLVDDVTRFGSLMVWQLWQPKAVFGLAPSESARLGTVARMQFDCIETSFLEWRRKPACVKTTSEEMLVFTPAPRLKTRVLDVQRMLFGG